MTVANTDRKFTVIISKSQQESRSGKSAFSVSMSRKDGVVINSESLGDKSLVSYLTGVRNTFELVGIEINNTDFERLITLTKKDEKIVRLTVTRDDQVVIEEVA